MADPVVYSEIHLRAEVSERLAYVRQIVNHTDDPELLNWMKNRLSEPYRAIQQKLKPDSKENTCQKS